MSEVRLKPSYKKINQIKLYGKDVTRSLKKSKARIIT